MAEKNHEDAKALPSEILTEILARLPAKSAGRFRCVSREWSTMLSSAYFVDLHARRANRSGHPRLLLAPVGSNDDGYIYSWQPGGQIEKLMPDDFPGGYPASLTKPCHGLILIQCIGYGDGGYVVCNPSTGAVLPLPDSEVPLKLAWRPSIRNQPEAPFFYAVAYGLGYCSMTKEYKVVRFFSGSGVSSCEVFILDKPAYWRPTAKKPPACFIEENPAVFLNGHLHFLCRDAGITTLDTSNETFGFLPPPTGFKNASPALTELDGCLCFYYGEPESDDPYHVFLLRDYIEGRWEKLCSIDRTSWPESERILLRSLRVAPLCMYHSGDGRKKIMFGTGACKVFAVDPDSGAPEILFAPDGTIIGSCEDDYYLPLGMFKEHLSSVGRTLEEMVFLSPMTKAWMDILKWMPARSVSELSLVCREWRAMIMSDCFIQSHLVHANLNKSPRIMFIGDPRFGYYMDLKDFGDAVVPAFINGPVCSQSCHGLNVGSYGSFDFVCNPCMGYCEHIDLDDRDVAFFAGRIGLGYDSEINKHVLVRITYKEKNLDTRDYELQCELRYVKEKQWRSVDPPPRPIADMPPTYVNGKIYWMVEPNLGPIFVRCEIVAFNVERDEFEVLGGPPCSNDNGRMSILQLQGALCVACSNKSMNVIDIWMMKDTGTWLMEYHIELKKFSPEYLSENTTPLAVDPKDGRILLNTGLSLGYYDPKMVALETIYSMGMPENDCKFCPIISDESLVCPLGSF